MIMLSFLSFEEKRVEVIYGFSLDNHGKCQKMLQTKQGDTYVQALEMMNIKRIILTLNFFSVRIRFLATC